MGIRFLRRRKEREREGRRGFNGDDGHGAVSLSLSPEISEIRGSLRVKRFIYRARTAAEAEMK